MFSKEDQLNIEKNDVKQLRLFEEETYRARIYNIRKTSFVLVQQ